MGRLQNFPLVDNTGNKKAEKIQNDHSRREIKAHEGAGTGRRGREGRALVLSLHAPKAFLQIWISKPSLQKSFDILVPLSCVQTAKSFC